MELCRGGDLFEHVKKKGKLTEREAATIMSSLISVVTACHIKGVVHRDIKPENIMLVCEDDITDIRVVDFGEAALISPEEVLDSVAGSVYYIAPEVLKGCYGPECDIWSLGVVLYILLCGEPPFNGSTEKEVFDRIRWGELKMDENRWAFISHEGKDLVRRMLELSPQKRITADACSRKFS